MIHIGIDIGGTFTDFVSYEPSTGKIDTLKVLSTPDDPSFAVLQGIQQILTGYPDNHPQFKCVHGSTVATNALLERKGARSALITTLGFKDILHIGRQNRSELYDFSIEKPIPIIPQDQCYEISERIDSKGTVLSPFIPASLHEIVKDLLEKKIESVAVSLLFSFLYPDHEEMIANVLTANGLHVSISSKILPEFREYERTSTTAINAYVSPILEKYLTTLANTFLDVKLQVMQSNGGMISLNEAKKYGVKCILSGPAGGVIGAEYITKMVVARDNQKQAGKNNHAKLIAFDMGGTSTDVSLINGTPSLTSDSIIDGYPIRIPMLDIHTIGAGGGSIAYIDRGGALRVGPVSAGAYPGPACYGKGELPTVTDAQLVLGRIIPDLFLGGKMQLDASRAERAILSLADKLGMDKNQTALGIIKIVNAHMTRALRVISVERGHDPREFLLVAFGGAGGLHASDLARMVGIQQIIISPYASTLSALGMLASDIVKDYVQTVMLPGDTSFIMLNQEFSQLLKRAELEFTNEDLPDKEILIQRSLDMRYKGQSYELNIPFTIDLIKSFEETHQKLYGYSNPDFPIEIVNLRLQARGKVSKPTLHPQAHRSFQSAQAIATSYSVTYPVEVLETPVFRGEELEFGNRIIGPALIVRADTTVLLNQGDLCEIDEYLNMVIKLNIT